MIIFIMINFSIFIYILFKLSLIMKLILRIYFFKYQRLKINNYYLIFYLLPKNKIILVKI